jgi:hypothetical protein
MWHRLLFLLTLSLTGLAHAQDAGAPDLRPTEADDLRNQLSARTLGMGGAWRALGVGAESGLGNPASLAALRAYRIELSGGWDWSQKDAYGMAAIADSVTSPLAAGVTYQVASLNRGPLRTTAHINTLASALPLADSFMVGASVRYALLRGAREANVVTGDAGLLVRPFPFISLGVSGHNLIQTNIPELSRHYSAHVGVLLGLLTVAGDVVADFETRERTILSYNGGLEFLMGQTFPLRAGYSWDGYTHSSKLSMGLGFNTPGGGVDMAYQHGLGSERERLVVLTFKMQVR